MPFDLRWRRGGAAVLLLVGAALVAAGLWIPAKAALAQVLLERAWQRTLERSAAGESDVRVVPWSWSDTWPVARLELTLARGDPESLIVLEGASGQALAFGPGLARRGARNLVVAGHRDTHFSALRDVRVGDPVRLRLPTEAGVRRYRVTEVVVVDRDSGELMADPRDGELLTLVTCYPFAAVVPGGPLRLVVRAERSE